MAEEPAYRHINPDVKSILPIECKNKQTKNVLKCINKCLIFYSDYHIVPNDYNKNEFPVNFFDSVPFFISKQTWLRSYFKQHSEVMRSLR